jgi:3-phenylpropionate/trans-cinnamate dioxygenase ferredoxin subunit
MSDWITVAPADDFPPGTRRVVDVDDVMVLVFNLDGEYYAIEDVCTHDYASLDDAELNGEEITCPRHAARFNVRTGEALCAPAYEAISTFPVRIEGGKVQVKDDRWD